MAARRRAPAVDPRALTRGIRIESREHHLPAKFTKKLVLDHLKENPHYYKGQR
jgi:hypothetical protein